MTNFLTPNKPPKPPFKPKKNNRFHNESILEQESRDEELNNLDREEVTEDYSDSKFADRV